MQIREVKKGRQARMAVVHSEGAVLLSQHPRYHLRIVVAVTTHSYIIVKEGEITREMDR